MQVTETLSQGLKREYDIFLPASDLPAKLNGQLAELKAKVRINGFRPGKVPVEHLRRVYGKSVMADVVQEAIASANKKIVDDNHLRLAREPKVELPTDQAAIDAALEARGDLNFKVALEVLPAFEIGDFSQISLERPDRGRRRAPTSTPRSSGSPRSGAPITDKPAGAKAEIHDRVTVDFDGTIDGVPFEGGEGQRHRGGARLEHFHSGLRGRSSSASTAGEKRTVHATFPEAYAVRALAGKTAEFDVTVKAVAAPSPSPSTTNSPRASGFESLEKLKAMHRDRIAAEYARASRDKLKRQLLDKLDALYSFELPEGLVNQEFDSIWAQVDAGAAGVGRSFADENTTEEAARADYRKIAERRVRLGLLLAEVGTRAEVKVSDEEMTPGADRPGAAVPGPGKAGLGLLPQQPAGARRAARADLRGEGRRPHPRPRQGRGAQGDEGGAAEAGRRRGPPTAKRPPPSAAAAAGRLTGGKPAARARGPRAAPLFGTAPGAYLGARRARPHSGERSQCAIPSTTTPTISCRS